MECTLRERDVTRRNIKRQQTQKIYIFTEGDVTEPEYLKDWKRSRLKDMRKRYDELEIRASDTESDPKSVFEKAERHLKADTKDGENNFVFIVIDEDKRGKRGKTKQNLDNVISQCNQFGIINNNKVNCIFSNLSFEFWGLLHFIEKPSHAPLTKSELKRLLKVYLPKYSKDHKRLDFAVMEAKIGLAKTRARLVRRNHDGVDNPYTACSTTNVDELMDFLKNHFDAPYSD